MPRSPWLAVDAATPPAARARELRQEWERFVSGDATATVRAPVADSWRRSVAAGVDPSRGRHAPLIAERADASASWAAHPLHDAAELVRHCLRGIADESENLIVVSDAAGLLLQVYGDAKVRSRAADSMNFTEGALWSESGAGTNAIGTAVAADHGVQIFAAEHFNEAVHAWTCSAAPVHDPETGLLLGIIDLTGLQRTVHPHSLAAVMTTARAVESHLRALAQRRDHGIEARRGSRLTGLGRSRRDALADEQAALRRLAGAVAQDESPAEIFQAVAEEMAPLVGADGAAVIRFEPGDATTLVAGASPDDLGAVLVVRGGGTARADHPGRGSVVAGPIVVTGRLWGAMVAWTRRAPLPADTADRMANFTELAGIVIANAQSRAELAASRTRRRSSSSRRRSCTPRARRTSCAIWRTASCPAR